MRWLAACLVLPLLVPQATSHGEGDETDIFGHTEAGGKYALEASGDYRDESNAEQAVQGVRDAGGQGDLGVGVPTGGQSGVGVLVSAGGDSESVGVCMVTDAGPDVVRLPVCADLVDPDDGEDSEADEGQEEGAAEESEPVVVTVTRSDFAELPLVSPVVHLQPERDWFLVNMDMLVFADGDAQVLETTVLGVPVAVRATPVRFSWDFGDGSPALVTTGAGAPWPAEDISHVYTGEAEGVVITVTTTWSGQFQVAGRGPWIPIAGSTTTTSQSAPFRIEAVETHLTAHG